MTTIINGSSPSVTFSDGTVQTTAYPTNYTLGFKNRLINGGMTIDQRNAGASLTITNTSNYTYTLDRWAAYGTVASKFSVQQNAGSVTPPAGYINYLGVTSLSAYTVGAAESFVITQFIEGLNVADLNWGTANAQTVTLSFWVRSSLTGTFGGTLQNSAQNYSYPFSYTISSANTWTQISVTVAGPTAGTWLTTNGIGLRVWFGLGAGSSVSGTAGAWAAVAVVSTTGATSVVGTNGATFYITGVQLELGSAATAFDFRDYGRELILCQRYYEVGPYFRYDGAVVTGYSTVMPVYFEVKKRATPSVTLSGTTFVGNISAAAANDLYTQNFNMYLTVTATGGGVGLVSTITISAEL